MDLGAPVRHRTWRGRSHVLDHRAQVRTPSRPRLPHPWRRASADRREVGAQPPRRDDGGAALMQHFDSAARAAEDDGGDLRESRPTFPAEPRTRGIARDLYTRVADAPIISPHG